MECWVSTLYFDIPHSWDDRVVGSTRQPHFTPKEIPWYSFVLEAEWIPEPLTANRRNTAFENFQRPCRETNPEPPQVLNHAQRCLTAAIRREPVLSTWYGRWHNRIYIYKIMDYLALYVWLQLCIIFLLHFMIRRFWLCRSQWPRGLRHRSAAACLLRSWVRIPPGAWIFVCCVVCCQVEVSATSWSLVQRSPTDCGASLCVI